jgi:alpha-galactosidase
VHSFGHLHRPLDIGPLHVQADAAAALGVEFFVYDTEWFGHHPDKVGTWEPDLEKIPHGLEAISEYVRGKGMGFGLFIDPELAWPGTKMLLQHPDFFYPETEPTFMPGGFRVVNYTLPQVCEYVIQLVTDLVERYKLTYVYWELDWGLQPLWDRVDPTGKLQFAHYGGLYRVWNELLARYPQVMMHRSAQGGHRLDLGVMRHSHLCWAYEVQTDPHLCHRMQLGGSLFMPSLYLGCSVGPKPLKENLGLDEGLPDVSFLGRMAGTLFVNGYLQDIPPDQANRAKHWISVYKKIRHLLLKDCYRLLPQPQSEGDWDAGQFCDGTKEGVIFVFRYAGPTKGQNLFLRSLEMGAHYSFRNEKTGRERVHLAQTLSSQGLCVKLEPNSAKLYSYRRLDRTT